MSQGHHGSRVTNSDRAKVEALAARFVPSGSVAAIDTDAPSCRWGRVRWVDYISKASTGQTLVPYTAVPST